MKRPSLHASSRPFGRVLLLNPPGDKPYLRDYFCSSVSKSGYYWHPIDLVVLSGVLTAHGFVPGVVDAIAEGLSGEASFQRVSRWGPELIVFLTSAASWEHDRQFLMHLAGATGARMIGCGEIFLEPGRRLFEENPWLEAGIRDFTDSGIPGYLSGLGPSEGIVNRETLETGVRPEATSGEGGERKALDYRQGAASGRGKGAADPGGAKAARRSVATFSCGIPRHELFPLDRYSYPWNRYHPFVSVLTAYGCPHACRFCNSGNLGYKLREMENIREELCRVRDLGIRQVFVKDMSFGADAEHALEFCRLLSSGGFSFSWNCYVRLDSLGAGLLETMARAGCTLIQVGLETANPEVSRRMGKKVDQDRAREVFRLARRLKVRTGAHFVLGLPGETEQGIRETVALACELNPDYSSFNLFMPRYGSALSRLIGDRGSVREAAGGTGAGGRSGGVAGQPVSGAGPAGLELDPSEAYPFRSFCSLAPGSLFRWRNRAYLTFYLRPGYLLRQALRLRTRAELRGSLRNGWGLTKNLLRLSVPFPRERKRGEPAAGRRF